MKALLSVFTAAHQTGAKIDTPWRSLLAQTYANWEWVVVDDSRDPETIEHLTDIAESIAAGERVRLYRREPDGSIGASKAVAAGLCRGEVLVELDHDDELLPCALETVAAALGTHQDVDFVYSDWIDTVSTPAGPSPVALYPSGWGFGFGAYGSEIIDSQRLPVALAPAMTWETVRHIVSMPNHLRAWRTSAYRCIGGFNPDIWVGDDYELLVRTFLSGAMGRIPRPLYIQHHDLDGGSASRVRNDLIQELVSRVAVARQRDLDVRCQSLGAVPHHGRPLTSAEQLHCASVLIDPLADAAAARGTPLISVIVPALQPRERLERALHSVLGQTYSNIDVLVVGCASPFIDEVVSAHADQRVRHWNLDGDHEDRDSAACNYALRAMARGTLVAYFDERDEWSFDHLESRLQQATDSARINGVVSPRQTATAPDALLAREG